MNNKLRNWIGAMGLLLVFASSARPAGGPDTVFFEDLTFDEIRDLIKGGAANVILATGGTEDNGPQMVLGGHSDIVAYAAEKIARAVGHTLVAPVIAYGPASGPGTSIALPEQGYLELLEAAAHSLKASGFRNIIFIGDSSGSQTGMSAVAQKLNGAWKDSGVRILYIADYYTKSRADQEAYASKRLGASHSGILDSSQIMAIGGHGIRLDMLENGAGGDLGGATPQLGRALLKIKIDNGVAQIQGLLSHAGSQGAR